MYMCVLKCYQIAVIQPSSPQSEIRCHRNFYFVIFIIVHEWLHLLVKSLCFTHQGQYQYLHHALVHTLTFDSKAVQASKFTEYMKTHKEDYLGKMFGVRLLISSQIQYISLQIITLSKQFRFVKQIQNKASKTLKLNLLLLYF
jgi:hypothetical protein